MDKHELQHQAEVNSQKTISLYNPDTNDFTCNYVGKPYTIQALEITKFPFYIAHHIKKHLADHLLHKRGIKENPEADLENIFKEIEVNIE